MTESSLRFIEENIIQVLLVEDNFDHAKLIQMFLERSNVQEFKLSITGNLKEAISLIREIKFDVILLDLSLPESNGLSTFYHLHAQVNGIPIVVLSGSDDELLAIEAVRGGAQDYLVKGHADHRAIIRSIRYALERKRSEIAIHQNEQKYRSLIENTIDLIALIDDSLVYTYANPSHTRTLGYGVKEIVGSNLSDYLHPEETDRVCAEFKECLKEENKTLSLEFRLCHQGGSWHIFQGLINTFRDSDGKIKAAMNAHEITQRVQSERELTMAYDATLEGWSRALEIRDKETQGHSKRVTDMTISLATAMGIPDDEIVHIRRGTLLHDIGKMGIPDSILQKPGDLSLEEWEIMKKHPVYAYEMLYPVAYLRPALDIPYSHHERWDGSGYPRGLKGEEIPIAARIFSVVDVYDALCSQRPYSTPWTPKEAEKYLLDHAGIHFDPDVVATFIEVFLDD